MVGATRGTPEGFRADQASGSQQPPPPPPNLAEVMVRQTKLLNLLVQAQQNQQCQQSRGGRDDPQVANYQDFFSTQPPLFSKVEEPLHADAWLRTIESKFALLTIPCADSNKAHFAAAHRISSGIALNLENHSKGRCPTRAARARARSKLCKFAKGW
jgi:hypothetical protein